MAGTLFAFDKKENVILNPLAVKLAPGLKKLSQQEFLFVVLAYDYESPFHQFDEGERILKAKRRAFGDSEVDISGNKKLAEGITEYRSLQFNVERETQLVYQAKISQLRMQLYDATEAKQIKELTATIELLTGEINKIQSSLDTNREAIFTNQGEEITFIENWQLNQKAFKAQEAKKKLYEEEQRRKFEATKALLSDE